MQPQARTAASIRCMTVSAGPRVAARGKGDRRRCLAVSRSTCGLTDAPAINLWMCREGGVRGSPAITA